MLTGKSLYQFKSRVIFFPTESVLVSCTAGSQYERIYLTAGFFGWLLMLFLDLYMGYFANEPLHLTTRMIFNGHPVVSY